MRTYLPFILACTLPATAPALAQNAQTFDERFDGATLDPSAWSAPAHTGSGDGTFVGRTQIRAEAPPVAGQHVCLPIETYNPAEPAFLGSEIVSNRLFPLGEGLDVKVRARMDSAEHGGLVGGIFLYALKPDSDTLHDEIDFELVTNVKDKVQTNIYGAEKLGDGHVEMVPLDGNTIAEDHDFEIQWRPGQVIWLVDGRTVRTETEHVPIGPLALHLNIWAPDHWWPRGYNAAIQPATAKAGDQVLDALCVSAVTIRPLER
jgi:hypothetical protein